MALGPQAPSHLPGVCTTNVVYTFPILSGRYLAEQWNLEWMLALIFPEIIRSMKKLIIPATRPVGLARTKRSRLGCTPG